MKRFWWGLLVLAITLALAAPARAGLQEDVAARDRHDYATATRMVTAILRRSYLPKEALAEVHGIRGVFWQEQRDFYRAIAEFTRATELNPKLGEPYNNLAWILATCNNPDYRNAELALKNAHKAVELLKETPDTLDTLAAALAESGRFPEAVGTMEKVVIMCEKQGDRQRLEQALQHLNAYQEGKPWRDEISRR